MRVDPLQRVYNSGHEQQSQTYEDFTRYCSKA